MNAWAEKWSFNAICRRYVQQRPQGEKCKRFVATSWSPCSIDINESTVFGLLETASRIEFTMIEDASAQCLHTRLNASNCLSIWIFTERLPRTRKIPRNYSNKSALSIFLVVFSMSLMVLFEETILFLNLLRK